MLFTKQELQKYSLTKAIAEISEQPEPGHDGRLSGLELECSDALKTHIRRQTGNIVTGHMIPLGILAPLGKAINVSSASAGGFLVGQDLEMIVPAFEKRFGRVSARGSSAGRATR